MSWDGVEDEPLLEVGMEGSRPNPILSLVAYEGIGRRLSVGVRRLSRVAALLDRVEPSRGVGRRRLDLTLGDVWGGGDFDKVLAKLEERDREAGDDRPPFVASLGVVEVGPDEVREEMLVRGEAEVEAGGEAILVIRGFAGVVYVVDTDRAVCCIEGELGTGLETILGEPILSAVAVAVSAALAARRFSASRADMAL